MTFQNIFMNFTFIQSKLFREYFSNTSWMLFEKICRMGVMFLVTVWMARYLGVKRFGILNYVFSYIGLFTPFVILGLENIVVKKLTDHPDDDSSTIGSAIVLQFLGAFLAFIGLFLAVQLFEKESGIERFILIGGISYFFMPFHIIDQWFQAKILAKYSSLAKIFQLFSGVFYRMIGIAFSASLFFFIWAFCIDYAFMAIGLIFYFRRYKMNLFRLTFKYDLSKKMLSQSLPLIFSSMVIAVYMRIDQVMIGHMMNEESVGYYAAAVRISQAWYFIPTIIASSLFPAIINAKKKSYHDYIKLLSQVYRIVFYMSLLIIFIMYISSNQLIKLLYGNHFIQSAEVFRIHIWALLFTGLSNVMNRFAIIESLQRYEMIYFFLSMILNVALNVILIPSMGINGAALSTIISQFTGNMIFPLFLHRKLKEHIIFQMKSFFFMS